MAAENKGSHLTWAIDSLLEDITTYPNIKLGWCVVITITPLHSVRGWQYWPDPTGLMTSDIKKTVL